MEIENDDKWMVLARDAYRSSENFVDASLRKQWEANISMFRNKHPAGSKYYTEAYAHRSRLFRPKTRSAVRRNEMACAVSFFATNDVVHIAAENEQNEQQVVTAKINHELLNYRLQDSIPWFITCVGAYQDAQVHGVCISKQTWAYETEVEEIPGIDEETGEEVVASVETVSVDMPKVTLIPPENLRIDPAADWTDPIGKSPYVIEMIPMYMGDILDRMAQEDQGGYDIPWYPMSEGEIQSALKSDEHDSTRRARQGSKRQDPYNNTHRDNLFSIVWVHCNFIKKNGVDYMFYTLGDTIRLSDVVPRNEIYRHKIRPYVMGSCVLETHRAYPSGNVELGADLQVEANDIANQRRDNVRLALNRRHYIRKGAKVDIARLSKSTPGGVVPMTDPHNDVVPEVIPDVTQSSYSEQDTLSVDFDEIMGTFSPGSVQTNRRLNETVGGMNLLSQDSNQMTEYQLRLFVETWAEPVLKQLCLLEQAYETDEKVLEIAGQRAEIAKYGLDYVTDELLQGQVKPRVNVGFGATNPQQRIERVMLGFNAIGQLVPEALQGADPQAIIEEIFGILGWKDGARFFPGLKDGEDPRIQQLQQALQEMQMELESGTQKEQARIQGMAQIEQFKAEAQGRIEDLRGQRAMEQQQMKLLADQTATREVEAAKAELELKRIALDRQIADQKIAVERYTAELAFRSKELDRELGRETSAQNVKQLADGKTKENVTAITAGLSNDLAQAWQEASERSRQELAATLDAALKEKDAATETAVGKISEEIEESEEKRRAEVAQWNSEVLKFLAANTENPKYKKFAQDKLKEI